MANPVEIERVGIAEQDSGWRRRFDRQLSWRSLMLEQTGVWL
jgi:hypothetical protein